MKKKRQGLRALLLNASFEPICVVSAKRAVVLVLTNKADVIHEDTLVWHSADRAIPIPSIIRLRYYVKIPYRAKVPLTRRAVLTRDKYVCQYCGRDNADTLDHVIPRSRGGTHVWENLVACCRPCNSRKDDHLLSELGWKLTRQPVAPVGTMWMIVGVTVREEWQPYLGVAAAA